MGCELDCGGNALPAHEWAWGGGGGRGCGRRVAGKDEGVRLGDSEAGKWGLVLPIHCSHGLMVPWAHGLLFLSPSVIVLSFVWIVRRCGQDKSIMSIVFFVSIGPNV